MTTLSCIANAYYLHRITLAIQESVVIFTLLISDLLQRNKHTNK
jgi:hypothetical protein